MAKWDGDNPSRTERESDQHGRCQIIKWLKTELGFLFSGFRLLWAFNRRHGLHCEPRDSRSNDLGARDAMSGSWCTVSTHLEG